MATTARGGGAGAGREKRGTSPSPSLVKKPTKPSTTSSSSSPIDQEKAALSPTAGKPVPNYLKPTLSSKRSNTDSSTQKPALDRRRSFDRPPTSSQVQKAIRSSTSTLKDAKPVRSSSFSNKTVATPTSSSPRPALDRQSVKTPTKDVKGQSSLSKSRSLKKTTLSSTGTSKREPIGGGIPRKKGPKSVTSESSIDYETRSSVDQEGIEDDMVNIDNEVASLPEISEMPDSNEELGDPTNLEIEATHVVEEQKVEQSLDHDQDKPAIVDAVVEETPAPVCETPEVHHEEKEEQTVAVEKQPEEETVEAPAEQQVEVQSEEQKQTEECLEEQEAEAPKVETIEEKVEEEKKEDVSVEKIAEEKEEKETATSPPAPEAATSAAAEAVAASTAAAAEAPVAASTAAAEPVAASTAAAAPVAAAPAKAQAAPAGKKENQAYNAVIEETATKLRGKKNKVLALAGAFETVISLQDNNKN